MTLKERREWLGYPQSYIANKAHMTTSAYQRFECGERDLQNARQRTVQNLANAFECTIDELMNGGEEE